MQNKNDEFYLKFKLRLEETIKKWPYTYMYKFIIKSDKEDDIIELTSKFLDLKPEIITKKSSKGTFTSITINAKMDSVDSIIERYYSIKDLKGVIAL